MVAAGRSPVDRLLALTGEDPPALGQVKLAAFRRFLLLAVAVESVESLHYWSQRPGYAVHVGMALLLAACCGAGWFERAARAATSAAAGLMLLEVALAFPRGANHHYLQLLCLTLLSLFDARLAAERDLLLKTLRGIAVVGLFWAGLQKMLYGYYFNGVFLAYATAQDPRFAAFFQHVIPAAELERLRGLELTAGSGPYRVDSPLFLAISNVTYLGEVVPAVLLLFRRTRAATLAFLIVYIFAIELGARELFFGALMLNLLLLFSTSALNRRLLPVFAAVYLWVLAMSVGLLPRWYFT